MSYVYPVSVKGAARILDHHKPYWVDQLTSTKDILGQLYGSYEVGMVTLFGGGFSNGIRQNDHIFGSAADAEAWNHEIVVRRINLPKSAPVVVEAAIPAIKPKETPVIMETTKKPRRVTARTRELQNKIKNCLIERNVPRPAAKIVVMPYEKMKVNDSIYIPEPVKKERESLGALIYNYGKAEGKKFSYVTEGDGIRVWRDE